MFLVNHSKIRLHRTDKGWIVQIKKRKWYGKYFWIHLISVSGMKDKPWYYKTYDLALDEIEKGRQVYIVCPLIEEDEDMKLNSVENFIMN